MKDTFRAEYESKKLSARKLGSEQTSSDNTVEERIRQTVLYLLIILPAYKLKNKNPQIFSDYVLDELDKSIKRYDFKNYLPINSNPIQKKSIQKIYNSPNWWRMLLFSFKSLPDKINV
jgi:hypothetical protein